MRPSARQDSVNYFMTGAELAEWLNEYGSHGWLLCAVSEDKYGRSEFVFKRDIG
jgi:hypothetical protein